MQTSLRSEVVSRPAQVLIVDDHPILRHGIAQLVQREPDLQPCGEAGSVEEAMDVMATRLVDMVIVDLSLNDRSGIDLIRTTKQRHPKVHCLVLSMHDENLHAERALRAGARGYVMKQEATRKIVTALRRVREGHIYVSDALSSQMLQRLAAAPAEAPAKVSPVSSLSDRELEVLQMIGRGMKTGEIARSLHRSVHTVEAHRANIKRKLNLSTAAELSQFAFRLAES
jgi:two-component system, NarL family, response regulator NreC